MKPRNFCIILFIAAIFVAFFIIVLLNLPEDPNSKNLILVSIVGSFTTLVGSLTGTVITFFRSNRETDEKRKERVSNYAVELIKLDYELRSKSLEDTKSKREFNAPIKVYRELVKALLEFDETGKWLPNINEIGLLNIIILGEEEPKATE